MNHFSLTSIHIESFTENFYANKTLAERNLKGIRDGSEEETFLTSYQIHFHFKISISIHEFSKLFSLISKKTEKVNYLTNFGYFMCKPKFR